MGEGVKTSRPWGILPLAWRVVMWLVRVEAAEEGRTVPCALGRATVTGDRQNPWTALAYTFPLYVIFLVSTRTSFLSISIFLLLLFVMYLMELHKNFYYKNEETDVVTDRAKYDLFTKIQIAVFAVALATAFAGCYHYCRLKQIEYADSWDWHKFIWGVQTCKKLA